jgi:hypothetical protein
VYESFNFAKKSLSVTGFPSWFVKYIVCLN